MCRKPLVEEPPGLVTDALSPGGGRSCIWGSESRSPTSSRDSAGSTTTVYDGKNDGDPTLEVAVVFPENISSDNGPNRRGEHSRRPGGPAAEDDV